MTRHPRPPEPIRIIHIITRLVVGGAQENTLASVIGLRQRQNLNVQLLSGPGTGPEGSLLAHTPSASGFLTLVPSLVRPIHPWHDTRALAQLLRSFRRQRPHIVHTHSGKAGLLGRVAARAARIPRVIHTIHGPSFGPFQGPFANTLFRHAEQFAGKFTDHFVVVANAMRDQYLAAGIGRPTQYSRIFSGFPLQPFLQSLPDPNHRSQLGIAPDDIVVGMIARLFHLKGHDDLLDIAPYLIRQYPQLRFLLVGDGAWRQRLEQKAQTLGLQSRFIFTGLVPPDAIPQMLATMDLLVHLSRREGLPRALPQALAARRPIIAYDCDGAREICHDQQTGFLVPPGDHTLLNRRILELAGDANLRHRLASRGQSLVKDLFPLERMVDALDTLYHQLLPHSPT